MRRRQVKPGLLAPLLTLAATTFAATYGVGLSSRPLPPQYGGQQTRLPPGMPCDRDTLHAAFGHGGVQTIDRTAQLYGLELPNDDAPHECRSCTIANLKRASTTRISRNPDPPRRGLWEGDLCSKMPLGDGGAQYPLDLVETDSLYAYTVPLARKSDAAAAIIVMVQDVRNRGGWCSTSAST